MYCRANKVTTIYACCMTCLLFESVGISEEMKMRLLSQET